jgi:hypothetical protein
MATLSDFYFGDPRNFGALNQYYLGRGAGSEIFNQNYQPTDPLYIARRGLSTEDPYARKRNPFAANLGTYTPTQMGDFTPSAGLTDMGMPTARNVVVEDVMPQDNPNYRAEVAPEAAPQRTLGLLGDMFGGASALDEYMTPEQRAQLQNQGVMAAAMQLLASSGPSRTPVGLGQALGEAYGAGQKGYTAAQQNLLQSMTMKQKMDEAKRLKDIQARISGALIGEGAPAMPGAAITPEQAINAPGLAAGPTVARAALIGTPAAAAPMSQADMLHDRYINASSIAAQYGDAETAKKYADLAKQIRPQQETQGEPYRAVDGNYYIRLKSGDPIPYKGPAPAAKPSGAPFQATDLSGKQVLLSQMSDNSYQTIEAFGPAKEMVQVDVGGSIRFVDKNSLPVGTTYTKGLAPQIVGSADTGFFVYGGGGGGGTTVGGRTPPPAAAGAAGAAPPPGGRQAAPGMTQIIPGTSFKNDEQLRKEFTQNMDPFVKLAQSFEKIQVAALNPSGAGDISLIYGYMKILDPNSTVMQGEQASAQNAGSVPESIRAKYNSIIGGEKLDPNVRADFLNQARLIVESQRTMANDVRERYSDLARAYGLKPEQIIFDPFKRIKPPGDIAKDATPTKPAEFVNKYNLLPKKP